MNSNVVLAVFVVASLTVWLLQKRKSAQSAARERRLAIELVCVREALGETRETLDLERDELAKTSKQFEELTAIVAVLVCRQIKAAGVAADYKAQSQFWEGKARIFWTQIQDHEATKQKEETRDLGFTFLETFLSFFIPHKRPTHEL